MPTALPVTPLAAPAVAEQTSSSASSRAFQLKTTGETVRGLSDLVAAKGGEAKSDKEVDRLRRMAESVQRTMLNDAMIRTIKENDETDPRIALTKDADSVANRPSASASPNGVDANPRPASNASAYSRQMQSYRENA